MGKGKQLFLFLQGRRTGGAGARGGAGAALGPDLGEAAPSAPGAECHAAHARPTGETHRTNMPRPHREPTVQSYGPNAGLTKRLRQLMATRGRAGASAASRATQPRPPPPISGCGLACSTRRYCCCILKQVPYILPFYLETHTTVCH